MKEVEAALERLTLAVDRLAETAGSRVAERKRLSGDLQREQTERRQLETVTEGLAGRLDDAILRLRAALDS